MNVQEKAHLWGEPVWSFPITVTPHPLPDDLHVDVAVVGAGFTGLATAHYVLQRTPGLRLAVFEARQVGAGASGRTGGLVLEDTADGPLPGVDNCVATLQELVSTQHIACDLHVAGCWEIGRHGGHRDSPIQWDDHGTLQVVNFIPGGAFDPRKYLAGLAAVIEHAGGQIFEHAPVTRLDVPSAGDVRLEIGEKVVSAERMVFGTNAFCLPLLRLEGRAGGVHTIAVATEPLSDAALEAMRWSHTHALLHPGSAVPLGPRHGRGRLVIGAGLIGHDDVENARVDSAEARSAIRRFGASHSRSAPCPAPGAHHPSLDGADLLHQQPQAHHHQP